ncbi:bifunctional 3-(3-hydroxy-phenyl)propionate/3-hydroxycinnamic acid hydroxylase MhpA [Streptomyces xylophagus]|uniref:bifunctional 3-(3-hydroxy-phenyl)propionate/3-hydroxycinnamic acid hydroxylase MhpA n=1 Tax=Streptomyces xylophagus TaxID=285514 RepID=UPI000A7DC137|nr:bifunctional 3-(3-hydroxy-phenyl)propionate/3-hydroxycinnamic acid hydroxylase [Streptomyces xylophagus]
MSVETDSTDIPVVIVGAGPVGVTAALLLARHGVRTVVLERHHDIYPLPRAVAVDDEVRRILQSAGLEEEFTAIARPSRGLRLLDPRHRVMAEFPRAEQGPHGFPQTSMFDQPELERLLRKALARAPECELRGGVEVVGVEQDGAGPVRVTYRDSAGEHRLRADAVLGCDGANSVTRAAIGATWEDLRFEERWTVVDVRTTLPVRCWEGVDQVCDPARPATFMRVGEDRYRWEFRLPDADTELDHDRLRELVAPWVDVPYGADFEVVRQAPYTFRARIADHWRRDRVFLLGDAAHLTPPFVGQGLCTGLRDAHNLTWKLARVLRQGGEERLLDTYETERKPHARHVIRLAVAMGWAMTGGQDSAAALRRGALGAMCRVPGLVALAGRDLSPALSAGPLVRRRTGPLGGLAEGLWAGAWRSGGLAGGRRVEGRRSGGWADGGRAEDRRPGGLASDGRAEGRLSKSPASDGRAEDRLSKSPASDSRAVNRRSEAPADGDFAERGRSDGSADNFRLPLRHAIDSTDRSRAPLHHPGDSTELPCLPLHQPGASTDVSGPPLQNPEGAASGLRLEPGRLEGPADSLCPERGHPAGSAGDFHPQPRPTTPHPRLPRTLPGTPCPQPWLTIDGRRTRLDDLLGGSFAVLTAVPLAPALTAVSHALGARTIDVSGLGDDGVLAGWMRAGRVDAVLVRPDRVVMDVVPSGRHAFTDTAAWASLLHTTRNLFPLPHHAQRTDHTSLLRSTTR